MDRNGWLIILDFDGVLIDSEYLAARVELEELARIGCTIGIEEYFASTLGHTEEDQIWNEWAARFGRTLPEGFGDRTRAKVAAAFQAELQVIPGVEEALQRIYHPKCVASGSRLDRLERNLRLTGLMRHFEGRYFSATQVPRGKPHPDLFLFAAGRIGVRPERCIVVEDSPSGVRAARAAGMHLLTFTGGSHVTPGLVEALRRAGSDLMFSSMHKLPELVAGITG
ncbi:MAG: HAD family hydrolase [Acidobacteriota bacterium]